MSLIEDKVKMYALNGIGLVTGETKKNKSTTRVIQIKLNDKRFYTAVMERLESDGFIQTAEDFRNIGKIVKEAIENEKEISAV